MLNFNNKVPTDIKIGNKTVEKILMRNEVVWSRTQTLSEYFYIENTYSGQNTISIKQTTYGGTVDSSKYTTHLDFSKDKVNWTTINLSSTPYTITLNQGEKVYLRGDEGVLNYADSSKEVTTIINGSQTHIVGGNIKSLLDYTDINNVTLSEGVFCNLFLSEGDNKLTSAAKLILPSTVSVRCYWNMFGSCTSLTTAPSLPATTLTDSCYRYMFYNCTSLTTAPTLPATTLADSCYSNMFDGCTSLITAPTLPATTLAPICYASMFHKCTSLTTAPVLPATTLASSCYSGMFYNCTSLTTAPVLSVTTLANNCYGGMFRNCTSLTTAPSLPATTLTQYCYKNMFNGCSSLNSVTSYATDISASNCLSDWLSNVASTGTFHNLGSASYPSGASGIPQGWTEVNS